MCCICSGGLWEGEDCWVSKTMMMMITKGRGGWRWKELDMGVSSYAGIGGLVGERIMI